LISTDDVQEIVYAESNGHVTDGISRGHHITTVT